MTIRTRIPILYRLAGLAILGLVLAGCQESDYPKAFKPVPAELVAKMDKLGMNETGQIMLRIYKESSELEVWKEQRDGRFALLDTFNICKWSGALGPKVKEGDRQAPEGFYTVTPAQMNPNSSYYLSFNIGYPNAYDRALGRTGTNLMVHGACSSAGCYSMTDDSAGILFALARDSFRGGQRDFQIQAFPFRMTAENMAKHHDDPNMPFWRMLKAGADHFEVTRKPPKVDVCNKGYVFDADPGTATFNASAACPPYQVPQWIETAVNAKASADDAKMTELAAGFDAEKKKAATAQAVADARAAEKAKADAEKATTEANAAAEPAKPSLLSRMLKRGEEEPPAAPAVTATAAPAEPLAGTTGAPVPRDKPGAGGKSEAKAASGALPAKPDGNGTPPAPAPAATAAVAPAPKPTVGQFLKKKFLWWEDDNTPPAPAPAQPAPTANPG
jgi:murein L,D-transpeptidase YafK